MTVTVGIRELKQQATEILREVREERAEYIVTYRGEPVAMLLPVAPSVPVTRISTETKESESIQTVIQAKVDPAVLAELETLRQQIGRAWKTPLSAVEAVAEQRREL